MSKLKTNSKKIAVILAGAFTLVGCTPKTNEKVSNEPNEVTLSDVNNVEPVKELQVVEGKNDLTKALVGNTQNLIKTKFDELSEDVTYDSSIVLLMDLIEPKNESGKIGSENMSKLKNKIDPDTMINQYYAMLSTLENKIIVDGEFVYTDELLPEELEAEANMLREIENISKNVMDASKENNADKVKEEYSKMEKLFVGEERIENNGVEIFIRDLGYSRRMLSQEYAKVALYYARNYITEEQINKMDSRTDAQSSLPYIKEFLTVVSNTMVEKSYNNVSAEFNGKYREISEKLDGKVTLDSYIQENLVNYANLDYLNSDLVSTKDRNDILKEFEEKELKDTMLAVDAIVTYNVTNQNDLVVLSDLLVDSKVSVTSAGKTDALALNALEFNTMMSLNTIDGVDSYQSLIANPYFNVIYKYVTKQNFEYKHYDHSNNEITDTIVFQEISASSRFIIDEMVGRTLLMLEEKVNGKVTFDDIKSLAADNLESSSNPFKIISFIFL